MKIPASILSSLIAKTAFAISMEDSRYTLNGALLILKPDTITMVATDGHRLAVGRDRSHLRRTFERGAHAGAQESHERKFSAWPAKPAKNGEIEFARDDSHLFFQIGTRLLISRILTGQFPNYEAVLPRDNNKTIVLERNELNDAVRRVSQLADQRSHAVKFSVSSEGVELSASSPGIRRGPGDHREGIQRRGASRSASTANTCSIFWARPPMDRSASSSRTNNPPGSCALWPTNNIATAT